MAGGPPGGEVFAASRSHLVAQLAAIQRFMGRNAYAVTANGAEVELSDGRRVLDLGTWATSVLGHRPQAVVDAVRDQLVLPASARGLANPVTPLFAKRLIELAAPSRLERAWLGANGADVVEATLKLARLATGRLRVLAVQGGFHGRTLGALSVSEADRYHEPLEPLLGHVTFVAEDPDAVQREVASGDVAALIFEIVQGGRHVTPLDAGMLRRWSDAARSAGALVIVDEIQTGLWRCGAFSLALSLDLDPDAVLLGKALGGGVMPLSAALCAPELVRQLETTPYVHAQTFSGHPLACAAGLATLEVLPELAAERSAGVEAWLASLLQRLPTRPDVLVDVRVFGLMASMQFASSAVARQFLVAAAHRGILLAPNDGDASIVRVLAPLALEEPQMEQAAETLAELCADPSSWPTRFRERASAAPAGA